MTVLDASALLAFLKRERGGDRVQAVLADAIVSAVNFTEVEEFYAMAGLTQSEVRMFLSELHIPIVEADAGLAYAAAMLKPVTRAAGLSLGDRHCLALGVRERRPILTADRDWSKIADHVDTEIQFIR